MGLARRTVVKIGAYRRRRQQCTPTRVQATGVLKAIELLFRLVVNSKSGQITTSVKRLRSFVDDVQGQVNIYLHDHGRLPSVYKGTLVTDEHKLTIVQAALGMVHNGDGTVITSPEGLGAFVQDLQEVVKRTPQELQLMFPDFDERYLIYETFDGLPNDRAH